MTSEKIALAGRCHCGNVELVFETDRALEEVPLRVCGCSFCVRQGGRYTSDPNGALRITVHDPDRLRRYRFGMKTADFLICGTCGVSLAATASIDGATYAVINVNTFERAGNFTQTPTAMDYDAEDEVTRNARRRARWTPVVEFVEDRN